MPAITAGLPGPSRPVRVEPLRLPKPAQEPVKEPTKEPVKA